MEQITSHVISELNDVKLRAVAVRVAKAFRLAAEKAVANFHDPKSFPIPTDPDSLEQLMLTRFVQLKKVQQDRAVLKVMAAVNAPARARTRYYGDLAAVNLRAGQPVLDQARALPFPQLLKFPLSHLEELAKDPSRLAPIAPIAPVSRPVMAPLPAEVVMAGTATHLQTQPIALAAAPQMHKLELRLHHVKCIDETDGFLGSHLGEDEIDLGGVAIAPTGATKKIAPFHVGDFDSGEVKNYAQPKQFTVFSLADGNSWPKAYVVTLALAEIDNGGFPDYLTKLYGKVKDWAITALGAAIGGAIGAGLGAIVGAVIGFILDLLFGWLISIWEDDVFPPVTVATVIKSPTARWPGGKTDSPESDAYFTAHGGKYRIRYDWRLLA